MGCFRSSCTRRGGVLDGACVCPRKPAALVGALAALAYALLAGFSVPTQRTVYMLAVVAIAVLFDRTSSPSRVLLLALLLVTLIDPWAPLAAGFWLSFGAVAFILYLGLLPILPFTSYWVRCCRWTFYCSSPKLWSAG